MSRVLVAAGEASGDLHAARLISSLRRSVPDLDLFGLGGNELVKVGMVQVADSSEISVVGVTEVLKILGRARQIFAELLEVVDENPPDLAILVDFPDFNLRLAKQLAARGIPVVYYISPQVWAWRGRRVKLISRCVSKMLVLFSFEEKWYQDHGVSAVHVGHPLVDEVPQLEQVWDMQESQENSPGGRKRLTLLPGSRRSEVNALLPTMLASAAAIGADQEIEIQLVKAPSLSSEFLAKLIEEHAPGVSVELVTENRFQVIAESHLALCASGTATLEVGMLGTPMVVLYKLKPISYWLARALVKLPSFSLVNLVLGAAVVPELLQHEANPRRIALEALRLLTDRKHREKQRQGLGRVRHCLGESGGSKRAAEEVLACLRNVA